MKKLHLLYLFLLLMPCYGRGQTARLEFVQNKGQWQGDFQYKSITGTGDIFLHRDGITYLLAEQGAWDKIDAYKHGQSKISPKINCHAYRMTFENCLQATFSESKIQKHYYNYFLGNDSSRWKSNLHPALAIDYQEIYHGINLHLSSEGPNLKYDFIVAPDADAAQIKLKFDGVDKLKINKEGSLVIYTSVGEVKELKPEVYQYINDQQKKVACKYVLENNRLGFEFPDDYDHTKTLVIDPTVVFCTFTGSTADNWGFTATYDKSGNMYTGGIAEDFGFPVTVGAFQAGFAGGTTTSGSLFACDMAIMKLNPTGTAKVYATYIGGANNDQPHSMVVDNFDNLIIAGRTYSTNFPTTVTGYDRTANGKADIVITKLNASGTGLIGSTYVGGTGDDCVNFDAQEFVGGSLKHNYGDDARSEVIVDDVGSIYVAASTFSTDFPTRNPIQSTLGGSQDAVLLKMNNDLSAMIFGTYLGGFADDAGYVLALNKAQTSIFMGGGTASSNFPTTTGTYKSAPSGGIDGYIVKISNGPAYTLQRGTYIGTSNYDQVYGVAFDANDDLYMMGQTLGGTFPVSAGVYSIPFSSQFVMKMDNNLNAPIYSTVYGSGTSSETNISPVAFQVDTCQNVYISGWGGTLGGTAFPNVGTTTGMPITPATAIQSITDGQDFYFIVLSKNATSLLYGSYFGRSSSTPLHGEHVDGGTSRFDKNGIIYQAICGGCLSSVGSAPGPFPTTTGSLSPANGSTNCNLAALKISFDLSAVVAKAAADPAGKGCSPFTVKFVNTSKNATDYIWDFADGSPFSTTKEPTHTFYIPGTYQVRLVVHNPDACIEYDTSYVQIIVDSNSIVADFTTIKIDTCISPYKVRFTNTSTYGKSGSASFIWDFGDGSSKFTGVTPPIHNYTKTGTYLITLIMNDPFACNNPDTVKKTVTIDNKFVKAVTSLPDNLCIRSGGLLFTNASTNAVSVWWDFGDGTTSTDATPTHIYDTGTYTITLIVTNSNACNKSDTFRKKITIRPGAEANFDFQPKIPIANDSIHYTNLSKNAITYLWQFGDGSQSRVEHPSHLFKKSGTYKTCLIAEGFENCNDTICKNVEALIVPLLDVPTAFTPNGDGVNDILYVRGAAIQSMEFTIYNRWGQVVFQTSTPEIGWDGRFNGKPQPMESYAYVLNATFINGETDSKRGNITILE